MAAYGSGTTVPAGWNYNAAMDHYEGPNGERLEAYDVMNYGFVLAHAKKYGATVANGPADPFSASITSNASIGNLTVGNTQQYAFQQPTSVIAIETKVGRVGINIETGDITIPPGIGRDVAAREFWLGFQEHFQPVNKAQYEEEIKYLKRDLAGVKASAALMKQESEKEASKRVAEKVRKKYGNEKFIMLKPEDLIRFIEG